MNWHGQARPSAPLRPSVRARLGGFAILAGGILLAGGCHSSAEQLRAESRFYVKPTIAVVNFQAARSPLGWNVGDSLAEVLTDELVKTERFHVIERANLGPVLSEIQLQQSPLTRTEGKAPPGRLKNVEYLVKGKVTDFGHVSSNDGWARLDWLNVFGQRHKAVLRMTFSVVEVESGRIVCSRTIQSSVRSGETTAEVAYKNVTFGGAAFYRTPLGQVTADATAEAIRQIAGAIATQPWRPRIALIQDDCVVINGGHDRGVRVGAFYRAMETGQAVIDPDTGDRLAVLPGKQVGQVEVLAVHDRYAVARPLTQLPLRVGQHLQAVQPDRP